MREGSFEVTKRWYGRNCRGSFAKPVAKLPSYNHRGTTVEIFVSEGHDSILYLANAFYVRIPWENVSGVLFEDW